MNIRSSSGYSLLEVLLAMGVLVIGLLSLLAFFSQTIVNMYLTQEDLLAKLKARETLESIYTARNTQQITFDMIENTPTGIFLKRLSTLASAQPFLGSGRRVDRHRRRWRRGRDSPSRQRRTTGHGRRPSAPAHEF